MKKRFTVLDDKTIFLLSFFRITVTGSVTMV